MRILFVLFLILPLLSTNIYAAAEASRIASLKELKDVFNKLPQTAKRSDWFGEPGENSGRCGVGIKDEKGKYKEGGINLFIGDINNDGVDEYALVHRCGGSLKTDTILEVFQREGPSFKSLNFDSVLEKNGLDGSKIPLNIKVPLLSKKNRKNVINFDSPRETWTWEKDKFYRNKK